MVRDTAFLREAEHLRQHLLAAGWKPEIARDAAPGEVRIELVRTAADTGRHEAEAYRLSVTGDRLTLSATAGHGLFNGIQTLLQLMQGRNVIPGCDIQDHPAFGWRGYMIDVGRNYMSMDLLRQTIQVMAAYKLNVFHFHATEDIAWRIASKRYPQLTAAEHALRNKGRFYSEAEIKELIALCKDHHITFVPEIDMPGHSAAFTRAMGVSMQSDSGLAIVKRILTEFCTTYAPPYLHIGADEVRIANERFVPEVTAHIERFGTRVIGWQPGGNYGPTVIRQLWMDDNAHLSTGADIRYIDSRHLYLNHMDPLEAVTTIFNRRIADRDHGDRNAIGATLCMWPDRRVASDTDVFRMNPVYPGMLAFAERCWRGGGTAGWVANIGAPGSEGALRFAEFEERLLDHKAHRFAQLPFPYTRQSRLTWKLIGPYANNGGTAMAFAPEEQGFHADTAVLEQVGGTIVLRHWWAPLIAGAVPDPRENTTWYATTRIWSDSAGTKPFWIDFYNSSRSTATDAPPLGAWDNKNSRVWVNGSVIAPPHWQHGSQPANSEVPLVDEGYAYRPPTEIMLQQGWNTVLIKAPVAGFKGKDWQHPVKWMFTFVEVE